MGCNVTPVAVEPLVCPNAPPDLSVERVAVANLPTDWGEFNIAGYRSKTSSEEFVVIFKGDSVSLIAASNEETLRTRLVLGLSCRW